MSDNATASKYGKSDWDEVRVGFSSSLMVDTRLLSLAQNVELPNWPIKGDSETPSKYIDYTWEELHEIPGLADYPQRIDLLISILKETMAFDDPFGEMVDTVENATEKDDSLARTLENLGIPQDCPLSYGALSNDTLDFCQAEGIKTVGEFCNFSQQMAQNIVVGGDFKLLLNALMSGDEQSIARFLPFRPHTKGVHLIEAIGLLAGQLSDSERFSLLRRYGEKLTDVQSGKARLSKEQIAQLEEILYRRVSAMTEYFRSDLIDLQKRIRSGTRIERCFVVLDDEQRELIGANILARIIKGAPSVQDVSTPAPAAKGGFFSRLFGRR